VTISTITISAVGYASYASVAEADPYLAVDPVRGAAWTLLTVDQRGARLVAATRRLDLLNWSGGKAGGASQEDAWPRTGVTYADGTATSTTEVPKEVENACIILAGSIELKASVADAGTSAQNTRSVKAGSAAVEFFRRTEGKVLQDETAFVLVSQFLASFSSSASLGALVSGNEDDDGCPVESTFGDIDQWGRDSGFP
jgi:hypothetical protein